MCLFSFIVTELVKYLFYSFIYLFIYLINQYIYVHIRDFGHKIKVLLWLNITVNWKTKTSSSIRQAIDQVASIRSLIQMQQCGCRRSNWLSTTSPRSITRSMSSTESGNCEQQRYRYGQVDNGHCVVMFRSRVTQVGRATVESTGGRSIVQRAIRTRGQVTRRNETSASCRCDSDFRHGAVNFLCTVTIRQCSY